MITGIIDVGSNTIRLSIYKHYADGSFRQLVNKKIVAGLAAFVMGGKLSSKGVAKLSKTMSLFGYILEGLEVTDVHAFATAVIRYAENSAEILAQIYEETGIPIELISGEEEAKLSFLGAKNSTGIENGIVVDIGGASCEIITVKNGKATELHSLPIGSLSIGVHNIKGVLPTKKEITHLRSLVNEHLENVYGQLEDRPKQLCFVGGTARAVYQTAKELYDIRARELSKSILSRVVKGLEDKEIEYYHALRSAAPERFFTLLPGAIILEGIVTKCNSERIIISKSGVREGYLIDRVIKG